MSKSGKKKQSAKVFASPATIQPAPVVMLPGEIKFGKRAVPSRLLFFISIGLMGLFLLAGASQIGVPADEPIDYSYGVASLHYFSSLGKDTSYAALKVNNISFPDQKYYGAALEMIAPAINILFGIENIFFVHHLLSALAGIALLFFTGLIACRLKGWNAALLALWLLFLTPVVTGNSFFNSKDIPFATAFAAGIYFLIRFYQSPSFKSSATITGLACSIALAVSIRISGILLPAYVTLFSLVWYVVRVRKMKDRHLFNRYFLSLVIALIGGTLAGLLTYPNFWHEGLAHITGGLAATKKFEHNIFMLYDDKIMSSLKVNTTSYLLHYLTVSIPEIVLSGFFIAAIVLVIYRNRFQRGFNWMLFFAGLFPFLYVMMISAPVYNGWRHLVFAYPFIIIITAIGFIEVLLIIKQQIFRMIVAGLLLVAMVDLLAWQMRAFPYNYVYFNHISGGLAKAYKHYDTDYQQLSTHEGVKWLLDNEKPEAGKRITILSNNANALQREYDSSRIKFNYIAVKDMWITEWDYAVISTVFLNEKAINAMFPPYGTIHTVERFDVPLTFVVKRPSRDDINVYRMIKNDSIAYTDSMVNHILETNKTNTLAWYWKGCNLFLAGNYDESLRLVQKYNELFPQQDYIYELAAYNYYRLHKFDDAMKYLTVVMKLKPEKKSYKQLMGDCLTNLGRQKEAQYYYEQAK